MTHPWGSIKQIPSSTGNVWKYVFENASAVAESVLYRYPDFASRTVICCSTQSGCPVGCRFCGTGDHFVRSLYSDEIVGQPDLLLADVERMTGTKPSDIERLQIMFMSMGEPLLNIKNLVPALRELHTKYPQAALLISTSGPKVDYGPIRDISKEIPKIGLQFSVHESTDEKREQLIPFKAKLTLSEIADEGNYWAYATQRQPFFNYCAHPGNVSEEDADRLAALFNSNIWQATISVICERNEHVAAANERQRELAAGFQSKLKDRGFQTRMFDPAGQDDTGSGCGQLWFVQKWMRDHPELARPSVGYSLPVIHTPK
jgi:23S rRNA (adenine2503-C2)-methyltransferase